MKSRVEFWDGRIWWMKVLIFGISVQPLLRGDFFTILFRIEAARMCCCLYVGTCEILVLLLMLRKHVEWVNWHHCQFICVAMWWDYCQMIELLTVGPCNYENSFGVKSCSKLIGNNSRCNMNNSKWRQNNDYCEIRATITSSCVLGRWKCYLLLKLKTGAKVD